MMRRLRHGLGRLAVAAVQAAIIGAMLALPLLASQAPLFNPTSGTLSGLSMVQNQNNANDALATCNSGGSPPSTQFLSGSASNSDCWDDTSTAGWIKHRVWISGTFVATAFYDLTNSLYTGIVGGGAVNAVASAATTDLCAVNPAYLSISGTTTITSFGSTCQTGVWKRIQFAGALTLTYNATTLILPTGASIVTAAGDTADAVALGSGNWIVTAYHRATGAALSTVGLNVGANALGNSTLAFTVPVNLGLAGSVSSGQLAIAVTGANGATPAPANPVLIPFRSPTAATGTPVIVPVTGALSMTVSATLSMGCSSGVNCRIWIYAIDNSGAPLVGLMTCSSTTGISPCNDDLLYTTNANTNGTSVTGTLATTVASLTAVPVRIIGYVEAIWSSGSGWAAPSKLQLFGPGVARPGQVLQTRFVSGAASLAITPSSTVNLVKFAASMGCTVNTSTSSELNFERGATVLASQNFANTIASGSVANSVGGAVILDAPASTSSLTYQMVISGVCAPSGTELIELDEIMGALEPAPGDRAPPAMVG